MDKIIIFTSLVLFRVFPAHGFQVDVLLDETKIGSGEIITIRIESQAKITNIDGWVETPLKNKYRLIFYPENKFSFICHFEKTYEKGFLTQDWNIYCLNVGVTASHGEKKKIVKYFYLKESEKSLYFVLWVDDFGTKGELKKEFREWYRVNAGPISYALEKDDTGYYNLPRLLSKYDLSKDYLSHHFHAFHWGGNPLSLYANHLIYMPYVKLSNYINSRLEFRLLRARNVIFFFMLLIGLFLYRLTRTEKKRFLIASILCLSLLVFFITLRFNHIYVENFANWKFKLHNVDWCKEFLINARREFNSLDYRFPAVVRHGWNLPPSGIMRFYMSELGVLADASGVSGGGRNDYLKNFGYRRRTINWGSRTIPYYASLSGDYDKLWNGSEQDRGILEIPLTFPNFEKVEIHSKVIDKIKSLPNGALVSTYLHPYDGTDNLKYLVRHLRKYYKNIRFLRADEYVELYMRYYPRPIVIDKSLQSHWAFLDNGSLLPIRETDVIHLKRIDNFNEHIRYSLQIKTVNKIPLMQIDLPSARHVMLDGKKYKTSSDRKKSILIENVAPATYILEVQN